GARDAGRGKDCAGRMRAAETRLALVVVLQGVFRPDFSGPVALIAVGKPRVFGPQACVAAQVGVRVRQKLRRLSCSQQLHANLLFVEASANPIPDCLPSLSFTAYC